MSTARKHLGCAVYQDFIYAVGGRDDTTELNSVERYSDKGGVFFLESFHKIDFRQLLEASSGNAD